MRHYASCVMVGDESRGLHPEFSVAVSAREGRRSKAATPTLIIFGLKNAARASAGEEDEWKEAER